MVRKLRKRRDSIVNLKKFVYLISPEKIYKNFYDDLKKILSFNNVKYFQIRFKKMSNNKIIKIANKVKIITKKYKVKLIINDNPEIAAKVKADGCHIGQSDLSISSTEKYIKNKIIGVTCHGSKKLARKALKNNAKYIALGSFFKSKLKPNAKRADLKVLKGLLNSDYSLV